MVLARAIRSSVTRPFFVACAPSGDVNHANISTFGGTFLLRRTTVTANHRLENLGSQAVFVFY
jgi:hypothetical protein